jgi:hypothetical protein
VNRDISAVETPEETSPPLAVDGKKKKGGPACIAHDGTHIPRESRCRESIRNRPMDTGFWIWTVVVLSLEPGNRIWTEFQQECTFSL